MADTDGTAVKWGMRMEQNLWELRENCHIEETLCKKREELRAQRKQLEEKMLELSVQYSRETQDVKELEGLTMTSLLSSLSGTKQKNLEKERREAKEAALRLKDAKKVLEQVEKELQSVDLEVRQLRGSKEKYETALKEKAAQMEAAGVQTGFSDLEEKLGILETESIEVTDVLQLGNALRWQLHHIMEILQSARKWGRVDLIGGGSTSSVLKRERMEETRKALAELDVILGYFRKKFRETPVVSNFDTTIPVKQATPPIERSSSPEIITKVTPIATMIITADCLTIFIKLAAAIKVLFKHVKIIHNTAITPNKPI